MKNSRYYFNHLYKIYNGFCGDRTKSDHTRNILLNYLMIGNFDKWRRLNAVIVHPTQLKK